MADGHGHRCCRTLKARVCNEVPRRVGGHTSEQADLNLQSPPGRRDDLPLTRWLHDPSPRPPKTSRRMTLNCHDHDDGSMMTSYYATERLVGRLGHERVAPHEQALLLVLDLR